MSIVLASASPRRAELLQQLQLEFMVAPMDVDESVKLNELPTDYVQRVAMLKANAAKDQFAGDTIIIAADTTVTIGENILGKPNDQSHGVDMLRQLSGRQHYVHTAVVVIQGDYCGQALSTTEVEFREISQDEAVQYWATGEPKDKAGAYAIQGLGAMFVKHIHGSYSGVVGLPLYEFAQLLRKTSVPIFE